MFNIFKNFSTQALAYVIEDNNLQQFFSAVSHLPNCHIQNESDLYSIITDIPHPNFNFIFRVKIPCDQLNTNIEAIKTNFKLRNLPFTWLIGPSTKPQELGTYLLKHDFIQSRNELGMAIDLSSLEKNISITSDLTFKQVENINELKDWFIPVTMGFKLSDFVRETLFNLYKHLLINNNPQWKFYTGYLKNKPVATSRLFFGPHVAGLYHVATLPQLKGQGIGTAITVLTLFEALKLGYKTSVLRATKMGEGLYRRLGFEEYCKFFFYIGK